MVSLYWERALSSFYREGEGKGEEGEEGEGRGERGEEEWVMGWAEKQNKREKGKERMPCDTILSLCVVTYFIYKSPEDHARVVRDLTLPATHT